MQYRCSTFAAEGGMIERTGAGHEDEAQRARSRDDVGECVSVLTHTHCECKCARVCARARVRRNIYTWSNDKCNCLLLFNCLGAGVWTPSILLVGRFRTEETVLGCVEALFIGLASGIRY